MAITDLIPIPANINPGLSGARQLTMKALLGVPRGNFSTIDCLPVTNQKLRALMKTEDVGPFRVTGMAPAVDILRAVFVEVREEQPEVFAGLGSSGMLCAR